MKDYYRIRKEVGFTLVEIMIVVAIIALLAATAIPNVLRTRIHANESVAQDSLKTIASAEITYRTANLGFGTLTELGNATPAYIDSVLGCAAPPCTKSGYKFDTTDITEATFHAYAVPVTSGVMGIRSFCITEDGIIRVDSSGSTPANRDACLAAPFVPASP